MPRQYAVGLKPVKMIIFRLKKIIFSVFSSPEDTHGPASVVVVERRPATISNVFSSERLGQSSPNFMWSLLGKGERKFI